MQCVWEMWFTERPDKSSLLPVCTSSFSTKLRQNILSFENMSKYNKYTFKSPLNKMNTKYPIKSHLNDKNRPKTGRLKNCVRFEHRLVLKTIQQAKQLIQFNLMWINHINALQVHTNKIQPCLYSSFSQVCEYCYFPLTFLIWFILTRTPWPRSLRIISFSASLNW